MCYIGTPLHSFSLPTITKDLSALHGAQCPGERPAKTGVPSVQHLSHVIMRIGLTPMFLTAPEGHGIPLVDECAVSG
jgi:hypothetical protein